MLPDSTRRLLRAQAHQAPTLPAMWHVNAARIAAASNDTELLAALAARPDSPRELLDLYTSIKNPSVRSALLTRPGLDPEVRSNLLRSETRANVLSDAYCVADADVRSIILERFTTKPTQVLAQALLHQANLPTEATLGVLRALGPKLPTLSYTNASRLEQLCDTATQNAEPQHLADALTASPLLARRVIERHTGHLPGSALAALIAAADSSDADTYGYPTRRFHDALIALYSTGMPDPQVDHAACEAAKHMHPTTAESFTAARGIANGTATLAELSTAADAGLTAAQVALAVHTSAPMHERERNTARAAETLAATLEGIRALPEQLRDVVALEATRKFTEADGWSTYADPAAAKARVCNQLNAHLEEAPSGRLRVFTDWRTASVIENIHAIDPAQLRNLPWKRLQALTGTGHPELLTWLATTMAELDHEAWDTFATLANDWTGTLDELLKASNRL